MVHPEQGPRLDVAVTSLECQHASGSQQTLGDAGVPGQAVRGVLWWEQPPAKEEYFTLAILRKGDKRKQTVFCYCF